MLSSNRAIFFIIIFAFFSCLLKGQLKNEIDNIIDNLPSSTKTAVFIFDPKTGDTLYSRSIHDEMIPASNAKLFTTAAALSILGSKYELQTKLFTDCAISPDGIINGNLYINGLGNPAFSGSDLDKFVDTLIKLGLKNINGNIIADDSYFDTNFSHGNVFIDGEHLLSVPPVSALSLDRNTIYLKLLNAKKNGEKLDYNFFPNYSFISLNMDARTTKFRSSPRVSYRFDGNNIIIRVLGGMHQRVNQINYLIYVENPSLYCALAFQEKLKNEGIIISGNCRIGKTPLNASEVTNCKITVNDILPAINKNSDNFYAESLFKSLGAEYSGNVGNNYFAEHAVTKFVHDKNISKEAFKIADGSGISRSNIVTANLVVRLLEYVYNNNTIFDDYYNSLSIAGRDGTLRDRLNGTKAENNFRGKTGTIYGVSSISGYFDKEEDSMIILSILMSFRESGAKVHKEAQDKIIALLAGQK